MPPLVRAAARGCRFRSRAWSRACCGAGEHDEGDQEQAERPPAVAAEGAHLLPPPQRGEPRGPGALKTQAARVGLAEHVPDAAHDEGETEDRGGKTAGAARGRENLHSDGCDAGEDDAECPRRHPDRERPESGLPGHDPGRSDRDSESDVAADGDDERCGQAGVTTDDGGADEPRRARSPRSAACAGRRRARSSARRAPRAADSRGSSSSRPRLRPTRRRRSA